MRRPCRTTPWSSAITIRIGMSSRMESRCVLIRKRVAVPAALYHASIWHSRARAETSDCDVQHGLSRGAWATAPPSVGDPAPSKNAPRRVPFSRFPRSAFGLQLTRGGTEGGLKPQAREHRRHRGRATGRGVAGGADGYRDAKDSEGKRGCCARRGAHARRSPTPSSQVQDVVKTYASGNVEVQALRGVSLRGAARRDGRDHGRSRAAARRRCSTA